jgi:hypothetical protein
MTLNYLNLIYIYIYIYIFIFIYIYIYIFFFIYIYIYIFIYIYIYLVHNELQGIINKMLYKKESNVFLAYYFQAFLSVTKLLF